ncbi:MAG: sensor histidine kinase [Dehalococcoidales bacterium]|nr:sensor histidine kinase [Dehalococcoidales bacterium]
MQRTINTVGVRNLLKYYQLWIILVTTIILIYLYYVCSFPYSNTHGWFDQFLFKEYLFQLNGSLFIIPFLFGVFVLKWQSVVVLWIVLVAVALPRIWYLNLSNSDFIQNVFFAFAPLLILTIIKIELAWRNKERKMLLMIVAERQLHIAQILKAQESERKRLSRELHDSVLQDLIAVSSYLQNMLDSNVLNIDMDKSGKIERTRGILTNLTENVRRLSVGLRPSILDLFGLIAALKWLVEDFDGTEGISARCEVNGLIRDFDPETDILIFRLVQEAINNIKHHANAKNALIKLEFADDCLRVSIEDDGKGFSLPEVLANSISRFEMGLIGMQERTKALNSDLKIETAPGKGTRVSFIVNYLKGSS